MLLITHELCVLNYKITEDENLNKPNINLGSVFFIFVFIDVANFQGML